MYGEAGQRRERKAMGCSSEVKLEQKKKIWKPGPRAPVSPKQWRENVNLNIES
jgi:hypothetical protein